MAAAGHIGAVAWMLREPPVVPADAEPPAAIMIDLSDLAVAPEAVENEIAPDALAIAPAEEIPEAKPVEIAEATPPDTPAEAEPVEPETLPPQETEAIEPVETEAAKPVETSEAEPEPLPPQPLEATQPVTPEATPIEPIEPVEAAVEPLPEDLQPPDETEPEEPTELAAVSPQAEEAEPVEEAEMIAVPLPEPRPEPPRRVAEDRPPERRRQTRERQRRPQTASAAAAASQAQVQAREAERTAARQTTRGSVSNLTPARWQSRLAAHLERRKRYPAASRRAREEGVVYVRFSIDGAGNVLSVRLARSSGFPALDAEVVSLVQRASPVPPPPPGAPTSITVPLRFNLR